MGKHLKDILMNRIRLTHAISFILIISITSLVLLGSLGYYYINNVKEYQNDMYQNALLPGFQASEIKTDLMESKLNITRIAYIGYNNDYVLKVEQLESDIRDLMNKYENRGLDTKEKAYMDKVRKAFDDYSNFWLIIKPKLVKGGKLSPDEVSAFSHISDSTDSAIDDMIAYGKEDATLLNTSSNQKAVSSLMLFTAVSVSAIILLLVLSILSILVIRKSIKEFKSNLGFIATGDLSARPDTEGTNEFGIMRRSLFNAIENFKNTLASTIFTSNTISSRANELSELSSDISGSAQEVAEVLQQVAADASYQTDNLLNINENMLAFGDKISKIAKLINEIGFDASTIDSKATYGNERFRTLIDSIRQMRESFISVENGVAKLGGNIKAINDIVDFIKTIAEQTNLLALNATIEAARAGEPGKGFSVVADQIRKLAEQSKTSSESIRELVKKITEDSTTVVVASTLMSNEVSSQSETVDRSIKAFYEILDSVHGIISKIHNVDEMSEEIKKDKNVTIVKISEVSEFAGGLSTNTEEMAAASGNVRNATSKIADAAYSLEGVSDKLMDSISKFKL